MGRDGLEDLTGHDGFSYVAGMEEDVKTGVMRTRVTDFSVLLIDPVFPPLTRRQFR